MVQSDDTSKIWWKDTPDVIGEYIFSFDKKKEYNFFLDYPHKLTQEEIKIFEKEEPALADLKRKGTYGTEKKD